MATKKAQAAAPEVKETETTVEPAKPATQYESEYPIEELAAAAENRFHTRPECVVAALKLAKLDKASITKTEKLVKEFLEREV